MSGPSSDNGGHMLTGPLTGWLTGELAGYLVGSFDI